MSRRSKQLLISLAAVAAMRAFAHEEAVEDPHEVMRAWVFEPGVVLPLVLSAWLYAQGVVRMWRSARIDRGIRTWEVACFAGGWLALVVALLSPVHPLGRSLFSVHMAQHEILMLIAAPLIVLGKPMIVFLRALPRIWASALARAGNARGWQVIWRFITGAMVAWMIHAVILWVWHAPPLMDAVIDNEWVHALQHLSFFISALLFWWAVIHGRQRAVGYGMAVLYMFTTALHSGLLGVLLTFATRLWYAPYAHTTQAFGLTPLEDQQLGGLIMWIPAGVVYIVAGLVLLACWMRESELRALRRRPVVLSAASASVIIVLLFACGCDKRPSPIVKSAEQQTSGHAQQGREKIAFYGCTSCHVIPGIRGPNANVGPSLERVGTRMYIGTGVPNNPQNMIEWVRHARNVEPKAAMPSLHINDSDARDIAAYLYTLQ